MEGLTYIMILASRLTEMKSVFSGFEWFLYAGLSAHFFFLFLERLNNERTS